ncbi:MAG: histidine phosphatase family protein [Gammaproteobacteria bacterium]|nr:histidine phosphatase family protein [Gammaproteobacteria bacterium]
MGARELLGRKFMGPDIDIQLVRHGEAAARWDTARDPPLSAQGQAQAQTLVASFADRPARRILTSPLLRAQETAQPLAQYWQAQVNIEDDVRELPSSVPLAERAAWLAGVMQSQWSQVDHSLQRWRERTWTLVNRCQQDTVIFTHFMVINALVGLATGDPRLVCFEPDYCSVTRLRLTAQGCELVSLGKARATLVL